MTTHAANRRYRAFTVPQGLAYFVKKIDHDYGDNDGMMDAAEWNKAYQSFEGYGGLAALRLGERGDITEQIRWRVTKSVPSIASQPVREQTH